MNNESGIYEFEQIEPEPTKKNPVRIVGEAAVKFGFDSRLWLPGRGRVGGIEKLSIKTYPLNAREMVSYFTPKSSHGLELLDLDTLNIYENITFGKQYEEKFRVPKNCPEKEKETLNNRRYMLHVINGLLRAKNVDPERKADEESKAAARFKLVVESIGTGVQLPYFEIVDSKGRFIYKPGEEAYTELDRILDKLLQQGGAPETTPPQTPPAEPAGPAAGPRAGGGPEADGTTPPPGGQAGPTGGSQAGPQGPPPPGGSPTDDTA